VAVILLGIIGVIRAMATLGEEIGWQDFSIYELSNILI